MDIDLSQFFNVFFEETEEHLLTLENALVQTDSSLDMDALNGIFRAAHSIKGSASTFGFTGLAALTHTMEALLDAARKEQLVLTPARVDCLLSAVDLSHQLLSEARGGDMHPRADEIESMQEQLKACMEEDAQQPKVEQLTNRFESAAEISYDSHQEFNIDILATAEFDWEQLFDILSVHPYIVLNPNAADFDGGRLQLHSQTSSENFERFLASLQQKIRGRLSEISQNTYQFNTQLSPELEPNNDFGLFGGGDSKTEDSDGGLFLPSVAKKVVETSNTPKINKVPETVNHSPPAVKNDTSTPALPSVQSAEHSSIRVSVDKVDNLLNLVSELVITKSMLLEYFGEEMTATHPILAKGVVQLERNTRALQQAVMSIRMVPISMIFKRFPRVVRDLASRFGKKVDLVFEGESTEIDKGFIEKLADPLTHLVRNSLDHGIESPEDRVAKGKNVTGRVVLRAFQQSGFIMIQIEDDGAGLNRDKIIAKARSSGLQIDENASDLDVWNLIFAPGFSTSNQVTDVSGRGVGMDVVRRNIQNMGGVIDLYSVEGQGSTITLSLPLTLAVLDGILVRIGHEHYIIPVNVIRGSMQIEPSMIHVLENRHPVILTHDECLSVVDVGTILGVQKTEGIEPKVGVIVETNKVRSVFLLDELLGEHQVVIKNLENNLYRVDVISGATIMGSGEVVLILDVHTLVKIAREREQRAFRKSAS